MIVRIKIPMEQIEYSALLDAAASELRDPVSQARFFIREELTRRGLLTQQDAPVIPPANEQQVTA